MASGPNNISEMPWSSEVRAQIEQQIAQQTEQRKQSLKNGTDKFLDAAAAVAGVGAAALGEAAKSMFPEYGPIIDVSTRVIAPLVTEQSKEDCCKPAAHKSIDACFDASQKSQELCSKRS